MMAAIKVINAWKNVLTPQMANEYGDTNGPIKIIDKKTKKITEIINWFFGATSAPMAVTPKPKTKSLYKSKINDSGEMPVKLTVDNLPTA